MKPPKTTPGHRSSSEFDNLPLMYLEGGGILRIQKLCVWELPTSHPMHVLIWLVLICIPWNKTIIISTVLSRVL